MNDDIIECLCNALQKALDEWAGWYDDSHGRSAEEDWEEFRRCKSILEKARGEGNG